MLRPSSNLCLLFAISLSLIVPASSKTGSLQRHNSTRYHKAKPKAKKAKPKTVASHKVVKPKSKPLASRHALAYRPSASLRPSHRPPLLPPPAQPPATPSEAVRYRFLSVSGVGCHVAEINLNTPDIYLVAARAHDLGQTRAPFSHLVEHHQPLAAITGTFFDPASGIVICNLVQSGKLLTDGHHGNSVVVDRDNRASLRSTANVAGHSLDWSKADFAISCGPTLVRQGRIVLDPRSEGFRDRGLFRHASRCGIGVTSDNRLLLVTVNRGITLGKFASVFQGLGARDAINLDGGSSTGMYVRGHYASHPARSMTNVVMVKARPNAPLPHEVLLFIDDPNAPSEPLPVDDFTGVAPTPSEVNLELDLPKMESSAPRLDAQP